VAFRLNLTRAVGAGVAGTVAAGLVAYGVAPALQLPVLHPVGVLAGFAGVDAGSRGFFAAGWALFLGLGVLVALLFGALWDLLPPRTRPVMKAFFFVAVLFSVAVGMGLRPAAAPAALAYALVLGLLYRPHPAPQPEHHPA
jgi:hypothetical protein